MTKANITQYSSTPSSNADINDINIAENCPASGLNNAIRELMAHLKNVDTGSQALTALSVAGSVTATTSLKTPLIEFTDGDNALTIADGGNVTANANLTVTSDLTIGDASASDKKILFDGNAVDYHIGLDDSLDSLIIGKGSALGTTTSMAINADGIITKPLQPAFLARPSATLANFANSQLNNINFATEIFDRNADYNAGANPAVFTAPVTGVYQLSFHLYILALDTAAAYIEFAVLTSNRSYNLIIDPNYSSDLSYYNMTMSVLADMDASDTANLTMYQSGGNPQLDLATNCTFSGYLVA